VFFLDYLLPFIAIVVSICALIFSVIFNRKTYNLTKEHNKKSVEPMLSELYIVDVRSTDKEPPYQAFQIKNCGFGPALIKSLTLTFNDKKYTEIKTLVKENLQNINYRADLTSTAALEGYIMAPNEQLNIFKIHFNPSSDNSFLKFKELASNISLFVEFETIYHEKRFLITQHLCRS
jgi:hypothetical protein